MKFNKDATYESIKNILNKIRTVSKNCVFICVMGLIGLQGICYGAPKFVDSGNNEVEHYEFDFEENQVVDTVVGQVSVVDDNEGGTLTYDLVFAEDYPFTINNSGELKTTAVLDHEIEELYFFAVNVKAEYADDPDMYDTANIYVRVTDDTSDNDNLVFSGGSSRTFEVEENLPEGTSVGSGRQVKAVIPSNINAAVVHTLEGTDANSFNIVSSSGQIKTKFVLDYDDKNTYSVVVRATFDTQSITADVTINVLDADDNGPPPPENQQPQFTEGESATRTIAKNKPIGSNIGSPVSASDADSSDTLTYSLGGTDAGSFAINTSTGQLKTETVLDFESKNIYTVEISVSDGKGGSDTITVTINVTDVPVNQQPRFTEGESATRTIAENTSSGSNIGSPVSASDADSSDTLTYNLGGTDAGSFAINTSTGQLKTETELDFESKNIYTVEISVSDGKGGSDTILVTINVTDVDENVPPPENRQPQFTEGESATRTIAENTSLGSNIGSPVSASDADSSDTLTYNLGGTDVGSFAINTSTGQLKTETELDFESKNTYTVEISVSDGKGGSDTITVTINVTDVVEVQTQSTVDTTTTETETETPVERIVPISKLSTPGQIGFSELMFTSNGGLHSKAQWIELYNNSDTETVNLIGWHLAIEARDKNGLHRYADITLKNLPIQPNQTALIVTWMDRKSEVISEDRVYNFFDHHSNEFEQNQHRNMVLGEVGLFLKLTDPDGAVSDVIGNLDGDRKTNDEPKWELPSGTTKDGVRTSLLRKYNVKADVPRDGTDVANWERAADRPLGMLTYWGNTTDIGNPGYRTINASLPVTLSHFHAEKTDMGVVIKWTTESEIENAGFNIRRSQSKQGPFAKVNTTLIQGAGTTGERNAYKWIDTTAKPNIEYYYRIEDVSFAGARQVLATKRMKGILSAKNRRTTRWGELKVLD